ncbi:MAG: hypothetical protein ACK4KT_10045 [Thermaurantimonas sp.]
MRRARKSAVRRPLRSKDEARERSVPRSSPTPDEGGALSGGTPKRKSKKSFSKKLRRREIYFYKQNGGKRLRCRYE